MANQLAEATSDYLQQHSQQPVDWWEWGDEALSHARSLDRPILLSVGYASCHWCHVMSEESFDDVEIAKLINHNFVPIKVDRQQRPDIDTVYLTATQAMNGGAAGWPMTAFLTPDGAPFFTGTYFPPEPAEGRPSFRQVLEALADAWRDRRDDVMANAQLVVSQLQPAAPEAAEVPQPAKLLDSVEAGFDLVHAGFGQSPKFPTPTLLDALLVKGDARSLELVQRTLEAMARGGIYDQVGGGFHRYSVDAGWVVPHFEKMLYDNALLLGVYVRGWRRTADHDAGLRTLFERTAYGIVDWLRRDMRNEQGGFYSALDADSCDIRGAVHEGIYYLWNPELLADALGEDDGDWAQEVFHVTAGGTFEDGLSTLQLRGHPDFDRLADVTGRLLVERGRRFPPATDRLVVAAWNAMTISSLLWGGMVFGEAEWVDLARQAATYLAEVHLVDGQLRRASRDGEVGAEPGTAEDYGAVAEAFSQLAGVLGDADWLRRAEALLDYAVEAFDEPSGRFYDALDTGLFQRPSSEYDHVVPSGTSAMIRALRAVGLMAERPDFIARADRAAAGLAAALSAAPLSAGSALEDLLIADEARRGLKPGTVVICSDDPMSELVRAAWRMAPAGSVIVTAPAGTTGFGELFAGRDAPGAYVCRGQVCFDPVTDYLELKTPLWSRV